MITVYTDGCRKGDNSGGCAAIILHEDGCVSLRGDYDLQMQSANRAELLSMILGLEHLLFVNTGNDVLIVSDSKYAVDGFNEWMDRWAAKNWQRTSQHPAKNGSHWRRLHELKHTYNARATWVKGHEETTYNILCDRIAEFCCVFRQKINLNFKSASELFEANESYLKYSGPLQVSS